ncbi:hypothetical protein DNTS_025657 [Danionella cerebrum]|uniref:Uncharacterized protein n=1 Tax=Danionella cerebrum TaxID=2873325 RepID=A0A553MRK5_9TELE|nr:hypothetical protein DNTS_025657 [Danionella translucida]
MSETDSRKKGFTKGRSATFSIDGFSFTIGCDDYESLSVANEDGESNSRPLARFAPGTARKEKGKLQRDVPDDPERIEEILADEFPSTDSPDATEKTAIRFYSLLFLFTVI